jgi:predicted TPR repeat methyltransferase
MSLPEQRLKEIIAQHRRGDHAAAEAGYREHLKEFPSDPSALHFLGLLRSHQGRHAEAVKLMTSALEVDSDYVDAWSNLGVAYLKLRDFERAEFCSRKAIELAPNFANAWANLGMTLRARNNCEEALVAWGRALDLQPDMRNIAISYGHLLYRLNRIPEAVEFYARWRSTAPDDPIPQHMLAAMGGAERPSRASDGYVRATFDDFADSFDSNLEELGYAAPRLLFEALIQSSNPLPGFLSAPASASPAPPSVGATSGRVAPAVDPPDAASRTVSPARASLDAISGRATSAIGSLDAASRTAGPTSGLAGAGPGRVTPASGQRLDVLDIGCGTGLCGPLWRPLSRRLVGVDLSPGMLSKAALRAVYDQLNCAELSGWLAACEQRFHVAVAADVFCYFGELSAAFKGVASVLRPGGLFACSLEAMPATASADEPFALLAHGRYQHSRRYLESELSAAGLIVESIATATLRYERQEPVIGLVAVARRPA